MKVQDGEVGQEGSEGGRVSVTQLESALVSVYDVYTPLRRSAVYSFNQIEGGREGGKRGSC